MKRVLLLLLLLAAVIASCSTPTRPTGEPDALSLGSSMHEGTVSPALPWKRHGAPRPLEEDPPPPGGEQQATWHLSISDTTVSLGGGWYVDGLVTYVHGPNTKNKRNIEWAFKHKGVGQPARMYNLNIVLFQYGDVFGGYLPVAGAYIPSDSIFGQRLEPTGDCYGEGPMSIHFWDDFNGGPVTVRAQLTQLHWEGLIAPRIVGPGYETLPTGYMAGRDTCTFTSRPPYQGPLPVDEGARPPRMVKSIVVARL